MPPGTTPTRPPDPPTRWTARLRDNLFPLLACVYLLMNCLASAPTPFWYDEVLTAYFVRDPSVSHMVGASRDTINTFPPLYFLLLRTWAVLSGPSEVGLRLFSCLCLCGAVWTLWSLLRPRYGAAASAYALAPGVVFHEAILSQNQQARHYALLFFTGTLVLWLLARLTVASEDDGAEGERGSAPPRPYHYALYSLAHLAMIFTHPVALVHSGAVLVGSVLPDLARRRFTRATLARAGAVFAAWGVFLLVWGKTLAYHRVANYPYSHIAVPAPRELLGILLWLSGKKAALFIAGTVLLLIYLALRYRPAFSFRPAVAGGNAALFWSGLLMYALPPVLLYAVSQVSTPVFLFRYLILTGCGWAVVVAGLAGAVRIALPRREGAAPAYGRDASIGLAAVAFAYAVIPFAQQAKETLVARRGVPLVPPQAALETRLAGTPHADLPVLCADAHFQGEANYYAANPNRYFFALDRDAVLHSGALIGTNYNFLICGGGLRRQYPQANVVTWEEFRARFPRFLVYRKVKTGLPDDFSWLDYRVRPDPAYQITPVFEEPGESLHLVVFLGRRS